MQMGKFKRVNKDLLREMLDFGTFTHFNEKTICEVEDNLIKSLLPSFNVVVDDCNLNPVHMKRFEKLAVGHELEVVDLTDVSPSQCVQQDLKREKFVGKDVIMGMWQKYLMPEKIKYDPKLPTCVISDLDGTLARMNGRSPYQYEKVLTDLPNHDIMGVLNCYLNDTTIILSGRPDSCKDDTVKWLLENEIEYDFLFMRKTGDLREDSIIKKEIYEREIKGKYNVRFILDDRDRVVQMWNEQGLRVLQVNPGTF